MFVIRALYQIYVNANTYMLLGFNYVGYADKQLVYLKVLCMNLLEVCFITETVASIYL